MRQVHRLVICAILFPSLANPALAFQGEKTPPWQVFDPPRLPNDIRLTKLCDLDHPVGFNPQYKSREEWEMRKKALREQLLVALNLWPMPPRGPLDPVIHGKIDRDDYTIEKVYFASLPGHYVSGNLYRPKGKEGKLPGILMPHGHHANGRFNEAGEAEIAQALKSGAEQTRESAKYPLQARCAMLARLGCVVFHYDMVGNADSQAIAHRAGFNGVEAELLGQSAMALQTWNSLRALDFLCGLPDVDNKRIGVTGASGGGTQTFILCAIDDRPAVACPAVMVSANMQGGCICENCSHLRVGTNNVEIAAIFAPRPMFMTCAQDWTHDLVTHGLPELKRIYALYGVADQVDAKFLPFPHNYNQASCEHIYSWFNKHLNLGVEEPIKEKPFVPVPPKDLSVFNAEHPRPKEASAAELRKPWANLVQESQSKSSTTPEELREIGVAALRNLIHDDLPAKGTTKATRLGTAPGDGYFVWKGTQTRNGGGEEIPLIALVPQNSTTAVVWAHKNGKRSLFDENGKPIPTVRKLLDARCTVIAPDVFMTGEYHLGDKRTPTPMVKQGHHGDIPFIGFHTGYNRTLIAQRVSDLLTVISHLRNRGDVKQLYVIGQGDAGLWARLACAAAGKAVDKAAIDIAGFEWGQIKDLDDERLLPGIGRFTLDVVDPRFKITSDRSAEQLIDSLLRESP